MKSLNVHFAKNVRLVLLFVCLFFVRNSRVFNISNQWSHIVWILHYECEFGGYVENELAGEESPVLGERALES